MIRHISVFFVKEKMKSQMEELVKQTQIWSEQAGAKTWAVGVNCMPKPPAEIAESDIQSSDLPLFGDFAQILDFEDEDAASAYPHHPAHRSLMKAIGTSIEKVVAIDIVIAE